MHHQSERHEAMAAYMQAREYEWNSGTDKVASVVPAEAQRTLCNEEGTKRSSATHPPDRHHRNAKITVPRVMLR